MEFQVFVNENKGTVAVKAIDPIREYHNEFFNFYNRFNIPYDYSLFKEFCNEYEKQIKKMVGISTCNFSAGDVFNRERGEAIARERYLKVFETYRINMYDMINRKLEEMKKLSFDRFNYCVDRRFDRENKINKLVGKEV